MRLFSSLELVRHTLSIDSRDLWVYFQRFFFTASTFLIFYSVQREITSGASGLYFFEIYFSLLSIVTSIGAINIFSGAVSQEKENGVIQLLIISSLKTSKFLLGRFSGKFIQILYLLLLQVPFCIFGITLGGVHISQVLSAFIYLASWLTLLSMLSFYISVLYSNRKESLIVSSVLAVILYILLFFTLGTPNHILSEILFTNNTSFLFFFDEYLFLTISLVLFGLSCSQFTQKAIRPLSFLKKRLYKNRQTQLWMNTSPIVRISMRNRLQIRFYPGQMLRQKDDYLLPPPPIHPFIVLFIKNPGLGMLGLVTTSGLLFLLLFANPFIPLFFIFLYLTYKRWSRLVWLFNYELEDDTFQSLMVLPLSRQEFLKDKINNAAMYRKTMIALYLIIVGLLFYVNSSTSFILAIVFIYILKLVFDYITILAVFKVRHAPKSSSAAVLMFLSILYFMYPFICIPLYIAAIPQLKKLCINQLGVQAAK